MIMLFSEFAYSLLILEWSDDAYLSPAFVVITDQNFQMLL